ncbi:SCO6745 family protein [Nocardia nepalensis]|uniref:SCO6745 family protein n=1 Tax=Nocardia nepalensis TaxID=3375448 RepID=UPI003B670CB0
MPSVSPETARLTFRTLEPIHGMIYFSPHGQQCYAEIGLTGRAMTYFAPRSAAMGPVPAEVTIATFFNFNPVAVRSALPAAWQIATPADVLAARYEAVDRSLRQAWGEEVDGSAVREAADLARRAAERACDRPQGRPLFAGHAQLPWPTAPHMVLWHAQTLLREFRGDGHVALLLSEGLDGREALITHGAAGIISAEVLRVSRYWSEQEWAESIERLRSDGWLLAGPDLAFSEEGRRRRQSIEDRTDQLAVYPYEELGEEGCARLRELSLPLTKAVVQADLGFPAELVARHANAH